MELNITNIINNADPFNYSASAAELGLNAGNVTWNAATRDADSMLSGENFDREAYDAFFKGFGAWDKAERDAMSDTDFRALMLQFIAGDMREANIHSNMTDEEWEEYEADDNKAGRIGRGDDGQVYYYIGE